jgi:hypothetical protein
MRKTFDRSLVQQVRNEVEDALKTIAEKYGLKASTLGNIGFNDKTMHTQKLTFAIAESQEPTTGVLLGDLIGKRYKQGSRTFTIIGVENGKLLARTNRGARYLIRQDQLADMIQL